MGFHALGVGFINEETIENGNGTKISARQALRRRDLCSGTEWDSVKIWAGKWQ